MAYAAHSLHEASPRKTKYKMNVPMGMCSHDMCMLDVGARRGSGYNSTCRSVIPQCTTYFAAILVFVYFVAAADLMRKYLSLITPLVPRLLSAEGRKLHNCCRM